jgi:pilus assembly protein Flp/PilA
VKNIYRHNRKEVKGMINLIMKLREQKGATAVEYALMVALIAAVIIGVVTTLGTHVNGVFDFVGSKVVAP